MYRSDPMESGTRGAVTLTLPKKIFFSLVVCLLLLAVLEFLLRLLPISVAPVAQNAPGGVEDFWDEVERGGLPKRQVNLKEQALQVDPTLPWSWIPLPSSTVKLSIDRLHYSFQMHFNRLGFRGSDFPQEKNNKAIIRIVCMGNSCTMGWGVNDDRTYPFRLSKILEKRCASRTEVINAGVLGYTSFQGLNQLKTRILELKPDVAVISYNWNDHLPAMRWLENGKATSFPDVALPKGAPSTNAAARLSAYLDWLRTFQLIQRLVGKATGNGNKSSDSVSSDVLSQDENALVPRVSSEDFRSNLEEMVRICRSHGIRPVLMTEAAKRQPRVKPRKTKPVLWKAFNLQSDYNQIIQEVASHEQVPLADPVAAVEANANGMVFLDLVHPNAMAQSIVAEQAADVLVPLLNGMK